MATTLSSFGSQKMRNVKSMASSLPLPKNICPGRTPFSGANAAFNSDCKGSG